MTNAVDRAPARRTRMQNGNRFKLGLFGMNCSGSVPTAVPERWKAGWPETRQAAQLADEAGLEFLLPIARWLGYGGVTDRQGTSFETLSWASALLAVTKEIVTFATVHVPLLSPVFAAKSCVTADHVGRGRFGSMLCRAGTSKSSPCSARNCSTMTIATNTPKSGSRSSKRSGRKPRRSISPENISI